MDCALRLREAYRHIWLKVHNTKQQELSNCRLLHKFKNLQKLKLESQWLYTGVANQMLFTQSDCKLLPAY